MHPDEKEQTGDPVESAMTWAAARVAQPLNPEIETRFTYHAPKGDQVERYQSIRSGVRDLAYLVDRLCPDSREKSLAFTALEECSMWANAAIARRE